MSWAALARQARVAASTIRRFEHAADAEADGVLAVIRWLGVAPEQFVADTRVTGELLPPAEGGMLRVDMGLVRAISAQQQAVTGSRTTIQHLVTIAQEAGHSVASFTRWSEV